MIHADELLLLAKEETALRGATDRLTEIGGCSGMEMNWGKVRFDNPNTNVPKRVYCDRSKTTGENEIFQLFGLPDARCTPRIVNAKAAFNKKKILVNCQSG